MVNRSELAYTLRYRNLTMKQSTPSLLHHPLAREIAIAIIIKLMVIVAIYFAFFSGHAIHPDADAVAARLASPK